MTRIAGSGGRRAGQRERGSGTVLATGATGALLACLVGGLSVVAAVHAAHTARAAADLSALAAAAAVQHGTPEHTACARAGQVAASNEAVLRACTADARGSVTIEVSAEVRSPLPALALGQARARARAGTVP